jgi:hypothetical protein
VQRVVAVYVSMAGRRLAARSGDSGICRLWLEPEGLSKECGTALYEHSRQKDLLQGVQAAVYVSSRRKHVRDAKRK